MPAAVESRAALQLVTTAAVNAAIRVLQSVSGPGLLRRAALLDTVPEIIGVFSEGSSALAADFYDADRQESGVPGRFAAEPVIADRAEKIGRAIAWASQPLLDGAGDPVERLAEVVQLETARPYRDTIRTNSLRDPKATGWARITSGKSCKLCSLLASRGAVYRSDTARFATHAHCDCTARPEFDGSPLGPEADVMQYRASRRRHTQKDRDALREYLNRHFPDAPG